MLNATFDNILREVVMVTLPVEEHVLGLGHEVRLLLEFHLCKVFLDRLVTGGLIVIDDYNTVEGATAAVDEFIIHHPNLKIEKLPYNKIPSFIRKC